MTARQAALAAGLKRYEGRPCGVCGGTLRDVVSRHCVPCHRARQRRFYDEMDSVQYARKLLRLRRWKAVQRKAERDRKDGGDVGSL